MFAKFKIIFLLTAQLFFWGCFNLAQKNQETIFVDKDGQVNLLILKLLKLTKVEHNGTLASIVQVTQKEWLRKPGLERWDIETETVSLRQNFYHIFNELKMFESISPKYQKYEYAFILGALFERMKDRFYYLIDQWNKGIRFNKIIFLAGSRPLNKEQKENQSTLEEWAQVKIEKMPETEVDLLMFIYQHIQMPEEMRQLPVEFINVSMLQNQNGSLRRPTTEDTIHAWLETNPKSGKILAVSNQPYVKYQASVMQTLLPKSFQVDTIGASCLSSEKIGVILDTLARILYQEQKRLSL